eukprot:SM000044S16034  [mRNA]  locus=s44:655333:656810:+ [translate_table: standard]
MGASPVYWETNTGRPPASGEQVTIYFNPAASQLQPNDEFGIGFNGGFNNPIMCGGEPRTMTRKDRGPKCAPFFTIRINGLAKEMEQEDACEAAIYPDSHYIQDRCLMPAGLIHEGGASCELDLVPGCIDPDSPFFDPLANVDDGSCPSGVIGIES